MHAPTQGPSLPEGLCCGLDVHLLSACLLLVMAAQAWRHGQQQRPPSHITQQLPLLSAAMVASVLLAVAAPLVAAALGTSAQGKHGLTCQQS